MPFSFPPEYRLVSQHDFQFVFAKPRKITRATFSVLYRPNERLYPRLGIIIPKRHIKQAVDRNRLRRVIRESFRLCKQPLKGLDIIVLLRSECSPQAKQAWRDEIDHLWQQL